jgi:predicted nuclease with TOPRIM domain
MPPESEQDLRAEVAGLSSRVDAAQASLEKNNEATAGLGEEVARLRGEVNGTLPRIDRNVEKIFDKLDEGQRLMHACHERTEVQANEIGTIFKMLNGKACKAENDEAHKRLWLFLRISLLAIAAASLGALVLKAFGT